MSKSAKHLFLLALFHLATLMHCKSQIIYSKGTMVSINLISKKHNLDTLLRFFIKKAHQSKKIDEIITSRYSRLYSNNVYAVHESEEAITFPNEQKQLSHEGLVLQVDSTPNTFLAPKIFISTEEIKREIDVLPPSQKKVSFLTVYWKYYVKIPQPSTLVQVCISLDSVAQHIGNSFEQSLAYKNIADFAEEEGASDIAFDHYYLALNSVYHAEVSDSVRSILQGQIYERIAKVFLDVQLPSANTKAMAYYECAIAYYLIAKRDAKAQVAFVHLLRCSADIMNNFGVEEPIENNKERETTLLSFLYDNYSTYFANTSTQHNIVRQESLYVVATILNKEHYYKEAAEYYLYLLENYQDDDTVETVLPAIINLSNIYAKLGNRSLAIRFSKLADAISTSVNKETSYYSNAVNRMVLNYYLGDYERASFEKKLFEVGIKASTVANLNQEKKIIANTYMAMYFISRKIHSKDAITYLSNWLESERAKTLQYINLLNAESNGLANWVNDIKKNEVNIVNQKRLLQESTDRQAKIIIGLSAFIAILTIFLISYISKIRTRKRLKEVQLMHELSVKNSLLNKQEIMLHIAKAHEHKSLINELAFVAKSTASIFPEIQELAKLSLFAERTKDYINQDYKLAQNPNSTIREGLKLSMAYSFAFQSEYKMEGKIFIINTIEDSFLLDQVQVPAKFLNIFIMNSIKYGLNENSAEPTRIVVSAELEENGYMILITDNGCGINQSRAAWEESGTGIGWAKRMAESFNEHEFDFRIAFSDDSIIDRSNFGDQHGTVVTIKLIRIKR